MNENIEKNSKENMTKFEKTQPAFFQSLNKNTCAFNFNHVFMTVCDC